MVVAWLDAELDSTSNAITTKYPALKIKMLAYFSDLDIFNIQFHRAVYSYHFQE